MTKHVTASEYRRLVEQRKPGRHVRVADGSRLAAQAEAALARSRSKYRNVRTIEHGVTYASKAEAAYARGLAADRDAGAIVGWLEQVPLRLPGGVRYVVDFLVMLKSGGCELIEIKGHMTPSARIKIRQARELYDWLPLHVLKLVRGKWQEVEV